MFEIDLGYGKWYNFDGVDSIGTKMKSEFDLAKGTFSNVIIVNEDELVDGAKVIVGFYFCHVFLFILILNLSSLHVIIISHIIKMLNLPKLRNYAQELILKSDGVLVNAFLANSESTSPSTLD